MQQLQLHKQLLLHLQEQQHHRKSQVTLSSTRALLIANVMIHWVSIRVTCRHPINRMHGSAIALGMHHAGRTRIVAQISAAIASVRQAVVRKEPFAVPSIKIVQRASPVTHGAILDIATIDLLQQ